MSETTEAMSSYRTSQKRQQQCCARLVVSTVASYSSGREDSGLLTSDTPFHGPYTFAILF